MKIILSLLIVFYLLIGCKIYKDSFTEVESEQSPLISGLQSYSSISEIISNHFINTDITILFDSRLPDGDRRPPYNMISISIPIYTHLDEDGELVLKFFNNRLMSTTFYPNDIENYLKKLKNIKIDFDSDAAKKDLLNEGYIVEIPSFTEVWFSLDYAKNKNFVSWTDVRLIEEQIKWAYRYATLLLPNPQLKATPPEADRLPYWFGGFWILDADK